MTLATIDPRLTDDGQIRLSNGEYRYLSDLSDAGDRGAFHYLYSELADNDDARTTAKIATFSGAVGGCAFAANWILQTVYQSAYPGIYNISQQIVEDLLAKIDMSRKDTTGIFSGTGYLTDQEHFQSAEYTWNSFGVLEMFPGNFVSVLKDNADLSWIQDINQLMNFITGNGNSGVNAGLLSTLYSQHTGKQLSDFQGLPGYTILQVSGGSIVLDPDGRTTAAFITSPMDDFLAWATSSITGLFASPNLIYSMMGNVGNPLIAGQPSDTIYQVARVDFTQYSNGAYNGDSQPWTYQPVVDPIVTISQTATNGRDLLMFGNDNDSIIAGDGDDMIVSGKGTDFIDGGNDDDVIWGQEGSDLLVGGAGNDELRGGTQNDFVFGGAGDDVLDGADISVVASEYDRLVGPTIEYLLAFYDGSDQMHGGTGNDLIRGGYGADVLYDCGADAVTSSGGLIGTTNRYDSGNDTLVGGDGADFLIYSGGRDTFVGGAGDDSYVVLGEFYDSRQATDELRIILSEDPNVPSTFFGHDTVIDPEGGVTEVVFEGLNFEDVTIRFEFTSNLVETLTGEFLALFEPFTGFPNFNFGDFPVYTINGRLEVQVNSTGSSILFENVSGVWVGGNNNASGNIYIQPYLDLTTRLAFDDITIVNLASLLRTPDDILFENTPVSATADDAAEAYSNESNLAPPDYSSNFDGTNSFDVVIGSDFDDLVSGLDGDDSLHGGEGNDTLEGGNGADVIIGGEGYDTASYSSSSAAVGIDLGVHTTSGGAAAGDVLISIEGLIGSTYNDTLTGDAADNILEGGGGADTLDGNAGMDLASYASSSAAVVIDLASLTLSGGDAAGDTLIGIEGLIGSDWNDDLRGDAQANVIFGGAGNDFVLGQDGDDQISGDAGDDDLFGGNGNDTIIGGAGNDTIYGDAGDDHIEGGDGDDALIGRAGQNSLWGQAGNDQLFGDNGSDYQDGGEGDDTLSGSGGNDALIGGAGTDTLNLDLVLGNAFNEFIVDLVAGTATGVEIGSDVLSSIENVTSTFHELRVFGDANDNVITGSGLNDTLNGGGGNDTINGGGGHDTLRGDDGDDHLSGRAGNDTIYGGAGTDRAYYYANIGNISFSTAGAFLSLSSSEGSDVISNDVEYIVIDGQTFTYAQVVSLFVSTGPNGVVNGTAAADIINMGYVDAGGESVQDNPGGSDTVYAGTGNDNVSLFAGNDLAYGGTGDDTLSGGVGNDTILGNEGNDSLLGGDGEDSLLGNEGNDSLFGDTGNDTLIGSDGDDRLDGGDGDDLMLGGNGKDTIIGGNGNDTLDGGSDYSSLAGGLGNDTYILEWGVVDETNGDGTDLVITSGSFTLGAGVENLTITSTDGDGTGNALDNVIDASAAGAVGAGSHTLYGLGGNDTLLAAGGDDWLDGGTGTDSMIGGGGDDDYYVDVSTDMILEGANGGTDTVWSWANYVLSANIENLVLQLDALEGTGNSSGNWIEGTILNNLLSGLDGNDTLVGFDGDDTLDGGAGSDSLDGGIGNDVYRIDSSMDVIVEAASGGNDTVESSVDFTLGTNLEHLTLTGTSGVRGTGNSGANTIAGNTGANLLQGMGGNDTLLGGDGNDTLDGGTGADSMTGGAGDDTYVIDSASDSVTEVAGGGIDLILSNSTYTLGAEIEQLTLTGASNLGGTGNTLANVITGNGGANALAGGDGNDTLVGGAGNDTLNGGTGADSLVGGLGNDSYTVDATADLVVELAGEGTDTINSSVSYTLSADVENLTLSGTSGINGTGNIGANVLTGNSGANLLTGLDGNDTLSGGDGNDTLDGGTGSDSMSGGLGNDMFIVDATTDILVEAASAGTDLVQSAVTWTLATNFENLTLIGAGIINGTGNSVANVLTGNAAANLLSGAGGNDTLLGGDGNDTLDGGIGNDSMSGGLGNDTYVVDATTDAIVEAAGGGTDTVQSSVTLTLGTEVENLTLTGTGAISGTGNGLANVLTGNSGANTLSGAAGNDSLSGAGGNDTLLGGDGNDTLDGGTGNDSMTGGLGNDTYIVDATTDVIVEAAGGGTDTVQSSVTLTLGSEVENLTLTGTGAINGTGNGLANALTGNSAGNTLSGGGGNDTLLGAGGNDSLTGGLGADQFVFNSTTGGVDVITDFNQLDGGADEFDVLVFQGLRVGTFAYLGSSAFTGGSDNSEARVSGNQVLVDSNGDGTADIAITMTGLTNANQLAVDDFVWT